MSFSSRYYEICLHLPNHSFNLGFNGALKSFYNNLLLSNNVLLIIKTKIFIVQLLIYQLNHVLRNEGFQRARISKLSSLISEKGEIF